MSSTNKTTNLGLSQWISSDYIKMVDLNSDNSAIDTAIGNINKNIAAKAPAGYGLGTSAQLLATGTDLNTVMITGFYRVNAGKNIPPRVNGDNAGIWHYVLVTQHDTNWVSHIAIEYNTGTIFSRTLNNGTWGSWSMQYSTINKPSSSDVGLGNVTNESKATMFTSPVFTGVPTLPDTKLTGDLYSADGTERHFKNGSTGALWGYYVNYASFGAFDWTNTRGIFNYSPAGNAFSIMPNGGTVSTKNNTLDDGSGNAIFNSNANTSPNQPLKAVSPDGSCVAFAPSASNGSWNNLVQSGDQVIVSSAQGTTGTSNLSIVPWSGTKAGIRLSSTGKVSTANNILDDGSGNATVVGSITLNNGTQYLMKDSGGSARNVAILDTNNAMWLGSTVNKTYLQGSSIYTTTASGTHNTLDDGSGNATFYGYVKSSNYYLLEALSGGYKIQTGTTTATLTANGQTSISITYPTAYTSYSKVIAGLSDVGYGVNILQQGIGVSVASATGCTLTIKNNSSATGTITVTWIAIGA